MRYYDISIDGGPHWTSLSSNGATNPGALKVVVDISVSYQDTPVGGAWVQIWGPGIDVISQTQQYWKKNITVKLGMSKGLPLAKPEQQGTASTGIIMQTFGNWVGVDQTLDLVFSATNTPPAAPSPNPVPTHQKIVLNWKKDTQLSQALRQCLTQAFPNVNIQMLIGQISAPQDHVGFYHNLEELSLFLRRITQQITGKPQGVGLVQNNNIISAIDGSQQSGSKQIAFEDLVGQPTWLKPYTMQFKTVMRADIHVGDVVTLPKTLILNTQAGTSNFIANQTLTFQGDFQIIGIRYVGDSRSAQAEAWVTIYEAITGSGTEAIASGAGANSTGGVTTG